MIERAGVVSSRYPLLALLLGMTLLVGGVSAVEDDGIEKPPEGEKGWWQQRQDRSDIRYPHKAHFEVMERAGDPCIMCHPFSKNETTDPRRLRAITTIANEPLEMICHECHVAEQNAPTACDLCHTDMAAIWPQDHHFDYIYNHAEAARRDRGECQSCHLDLSTCTDCHFRRDRSRQRQHLPGYRSSHGLDARLSTIGCSRCHNASYCIDCHRGGR